MKQKEAKITKHDVEELMKFSVYLANKDTSADLFAVYARLAEKYRMEYSS